MKRKISESDEESEFESIYPDEESGIVVNGCIIYYRCEVTLESVNSLCSIISKLNEQSTILKLRWHGFNPIIWLHLTTPGGSLQDAFRMMDFIQRNPVPINTVIDGIVASAGSLVALAGVERFITPNSYLRIHQLRGGGFGKLVELKDEMDNCVKAHKRMVAIYVKYSKMTTDQVEEQLSKEIELDSDECIGLGLVDKLY